MGYEAKPRLIVKIVAQRAANTATQVLLHTEYVQSREDPT